MQIDPIELLPYKVAVGYLAIRRSTDAAARSKGRISSRGTAFAVNPTTLLTAHHNVVDEKTKLPRDDLAVGFVASPLTDVVFERGDPELDVAVLRVRFGALPDVLTFVPLTMDQPQIDDPWVALGFPQGLSEAGVRVLRGTVTLTDLSLGQNGPSSFCQLSCDPAKSDESATAENLLGFSGAPWFLRVDSGFKAAGPIVKARASRHDSGVVAGSTLFGARLAFTVEAGVLASNETSENRAERLLRVYSGYKSLEGYEAVGEKARQRLDDDVLRSGFLLHQEHVLGQVEYVFQLRERRRRADRPPPAESRAGDRGPRKLPIRRRLSFPLRRADE